MYHVLLDILSDGPNDLRPQSEDSHQREDNAAQPHRAVEREDEHVAHCGHTWLPEHCGGPNNITRHISEFPLHYKCSFTKKIGVGLYLSGNVSAA